MPIQGCTLPGGKSGYRWGRHGKCYSSRGRAEKQAQAAFANGYRGDQANDAPHTALAAGVLLQRKDGRIFLVRRSGTGDHGGDWALPGGMVDRGEEPQMAAARELHEETGLNVDPARLEFLHVDLHGDGEADFLTYRHEFTGEFEPKLDSEATASGWFDRDNLPSPMHHQCTRMLRAGMQITGAMDCHPLAMDKETVRNFDDFGRMHVEMTHISKATINPYLGREIPKWEELGLSPDRIYYLLRDPVELAKSVPTWNKIPLLIKHIGHSSQTPVKEYVVGTLGESAQFAPPYLDNTLCVWDGGAIAGIETDKQKEISCSYSYVADMTPGEFEGKRHDGVMRNIIGNHAALVIRGRAGADVVVGDSQLVEQPTMKQVGIIAVRTALGQYLRPALANDATPIPLLDLVKLGMTPGDVAKATKEHYKGKFEVKADELSGLLTLARDEAEEMDEEEEEDAEDEDETEREEREEKEKEEEKAREKRAKDRAKKKGKDHARDRRHAKDNKGPPAGPSGPRDRSEGRASDKHERERERAEDQALITQTLRAEFQALEKAKEHVRPLVGALLGMDSAEAVYTEACKQLKIPTEGVHPSAFSALIDMHIKTRNTRQPNLANDSQITSTAKISELFPGAVKPMRA